MSGKFRNSIHGFNRNDVIEYIRQNSEENNRKIEELEKKTRKLEREISRLKKENGRLERTIKKNKEKTEQKRNSNDEGGNTVISEESKAGEK